MRVVEIFKDDRRHLIACREVVELKIGVVPDIGEPSAILPAERFLRVDVEGADVDPVDPVLEILDDKRIRRRPYDEDVRPGAASRFVVSRAGGDDVVTVAAENRVVPRPPSIVSSPRRP